MIFKATLHGLSFFCRILSQVNSYLDTIEKDIENDKANDIGDFMNWLALADLKSIPYVFDILERPYLIKSKNKCTIHFNEFSMQH